MAEHWMAEAFGKNPGALHRATGTPAGQTIPAKRIAAAARRAKKTGNTRLARQVNLAKIGEKYGGGRK